ncbi:S8 family serine peptidase, partial [Candidatus Woesearchaeota archaeon]|nr:S8 family serine peptidase [Candidatus Woesearchaeota archaeon]
ILVGNGTTTGIAPNAKIVAMKVLNYIGEGNYSDVISAMQDCISISSQYNISVISMSLGTDNIFESYCDNNPDYSSYKDLINEAVSKNISVVIATGNDGSSSGLNAPACIKNATRVGSSNKNNTISDFTNLGINFPDILLAPGDNILSTNFLGGQKVNSGTSMATPVVSGAVILLKQYKNLESNKKLTSDYLKEILNKTGLRLGRMGISINFSRINILSSLISIDEQSPNISYIYPENDSISSNLSQNLYCNATDSLALLNLTLKLNNSTSEVFSQTNFTNETSMNISLNKSLGDGNYTLLCEAYDQNGNNFSRISQFKIYRFFTNILFPPNDYYTNNETIEVNCSTESRENELINISLGIKNENKNLSEEGILIRGNYNYTNIKFNLTELENGNYTVYCYSFNNNSEREESQNRTLIYDTIVPNISLISPEGNLSTSTKSQIFSYSVEEQNLDNCILRINNEEKNSFSQTLSDGIYYWNITCNDLAGNSQTSETRKLTIFTKSSSGSGGGSNLRISKTYNINDSSIEKGYENKLKVGDKIIINTTSESHKITVNELNRNQIKLTIESETQIVYISLYESKLIDLNYDDINDLMIIYLGIKDNSANIYIKKIEKKEMNKEENLTNSLKPGEPDHQVFILNNFSENNKLNNTSKNIESINNKKGKNLFIYASILIIPILILLAFSFFIIKKMIQKFKLKKKKNNKGGKDKIYERVSKNKRRLKK